MLFQLSTLNPNEYAFMVFKIIDLVLFFAIAFKILKLRPDYLLNRLFFLAFLSWAIYIMMDSIIWIIAPYSYQLYKAASILRDVQIISVMSLAFFVYNSQKVIARGTADFFNNRLILELATFVVISIIIIIVDGVIVYDADNNAVDPINLPLDEPGFRASPIMPPIVLALIVFPVVVYAYALIDQIRNSRKIKEQELRHRMHYLTVGLALIPIGVIYFIIQNILQLYSFWIVTLGYTFWTISPFLIWKSQKKEK